MLIVASVIRHMRHNCLLDDQCAQPISCASPEFTQTIHELIGEPIRVSNCFCLERVCRHENGIEREEHNRRSERVETGLRVGQILSILAVGGLVYLDRDPTSRAACRT